MHALREAVLAQPMDIEELGQQARQRECCGYYAARAAHPSADLVLMPYSSLVHRCRPLLAAALWLLRKRCICGWSVD